MDAFGRHAVGASRDEHAYGSVDEPRRIVVAVSAPRAVDEHDVWAMNNLGYIYIQTGRSTDALRPLARAVEIRGNVPVFQNNFGTALERSGHFVTAREAYQAALTADSTYEKAAVGLERRQARVRVAVLERADHVGAAARVRAPVRPARAGPAPRLDSSPFA